MNPAAKHLDIVMGMLDIHIVMLPGTPPFPMPLPHPFIGMVFDAMDWIPITIKIPKSWAETMGDAMQKVEGGMEAVGIDLGAQKSSGQGGGAGSGGALSRVAQGAADAPGGGEEAPKPPEANSDNFKFGSSDKDAVSIPLNASVWVNGMPRGHAGTSGLGPPHFPLGLSFQRPPVAAKMSKCELLLGSKTVLADGSPFAYDGLRVLSCTCIGAPPMPRNKKKAEPGFFLPGSCVYPIPAGPQVLVGGPPTVNWMGLAFKLPGALGKLAKSNAFKKLAKKAGEVAKKGIKAIAKFFKCLFVGEPVDVASGRVAVEEVDFELPGPIPLKWERLYFSNSDYVGPLGHGWHWKYDVFLKYDSAQQCLIINLEEGRQADFPTLQTGEKAYITEEKLELRREEGFYILRDENRLDYWFAAPPQGNEAIQKLLRITNGSGFKIQFDYNSLGHLRNITDSAGRQIRINSDGSGKIRSVDVPHPEKKEELFSVVKYEYDYQNDLANVYDALDHALAYQYQNHLLIQHTDRNGLSFYYKYDGKNHDARCIHAWGDGGLYDTKLEYNLEEQWTLVENALGHRTKYFWNEGGMVYRTIDPSGHSDSTRFGAHNQVLSKTDKLGQITRYGYDNYGNPTSVHYSDGSSIQMQYENNLLMTLVDQNAGKWQWKYNEIGKIIEQHDPSGRSTKYIYNAGLVSEIIDSIGRNIKLKYDKDYNLTSLIAFDGTYSRWEYDDLGRLTTAIDTNGNAQKRKYTLNGHLYWILEPDGNIREMDYDFRGNIVRAKDRQHDISFEYGGLDKLKSRTQAGKRIEFKHDKEENLIAIINEHGYVYRFELDANGSVVAESGFDGVTRRYRLDAAGRVVEMERANGIASKYTYDALGRVIKIAHSDGSWETFAFRADGVLVKAANRHITVQFERDQVGRVVQEIQGGAVIKSQYDALGRRTDISSSLGASIHFDRDLADEVENVTVNTDGNSWTASFKWDKFGLETERALPGGVRGTWKRDSLGRPIEQKITTGQERIIRNRKYAWDVNDRLKQIVDPVNGIWKFEHDASGNLILAQYPNGTFEYRMPDAVGGLFRNKDRSDCKYGPAGQLLESNNTRYHYDADGNLIQKNEANGATWRYEWNANGMLHRVIRPDNDSVIFTYDALSRRIAKTYRDRTTCWVWDGNVPLHEWVEIKAYSSEQNHTSTPGPSEGSAIKIRKHDDHLSTTSARIPLPSDISVAKTDEFEVISPDGASIVTWVFEADSFSPLAKLNGKDQWSFVSDHLGTPVGMYDRSGKKIWDMDLSIYGEVQQMQGWREACPFRYQGQYEDIETGLYYNRFRYFDPESGIYISQDPIGLDGNNLNFYAYVRDVNGWIDVFGLDCPGAKLRQAMQEAMNYAKKLLQRGGNVPRMVSVAISRKTGRVYKGVSAGMDEKVLAARRAKVSAQMKKRMGKVPGTEAWDTENCAEFDAANKATLKGEKIEDLDIVTIETETASPRAACSNCQVTTGGASVAK